MHVRKFIQENPKLGLFLKQHLRLPQGQTQQRLLRYFLENTAYFHHVSGTCCCFTCDCGKCKCGYVHKGLNDSYNTVYNNNYKKGSKKELLRIDQEMVTSGPVFALRDEKNAMD